MRLFYFLLPSILFIITATVVQGDNSELNFPNPNQALERYQEAASKWPEVPRTTLQAFVAAEDTLFFERPVQISTITRQIGSWVFQSRARGLHKVAIAFSIGEVLSHDEVLNWYTNQVYLGYGCFGVHTAAMAYFGRPVGSLILEETAFLAALPKSPGSFHPIRSYDRAVERRNYVLWEMKEAGFISDDEAKTAIQTALIVIEPLELCNEQD